ncbi:hypothetical protein BD779DRAFT_1528716, partial [Infundibulicybe gibba]
MNTNSTKSRWGRIGSGFRRISSAISHPTAASITLSTSLKWVNKSPENVQSSLLLPELPSLLMQGPGAVNDDAMFLPSGVDYVPPSAICSANGKFIEELDDSTVSSLIAEPNPNREAELESEYYETELAERRAAELRDEREVRRAEHEAREAEEAEHMAETEAVFEADCAEREREYA